jgi:ectoine hydroxylase
MMKEAKTGGAWNWHQDYGYWYGNGCMLPEMGSIFMPIDR